MRDYPIIFSAPMVRALLDGRKTQTRRMPTSMWKKVAPGDRLWVREAGAFSVGTSAVDGSRVHLRQYRADVPDAERSFTGKWRPSIHMPRWASRLTLVVTAVKTERLQDISVEDAEAEGIEWNADLDPVGPCKWRVYTKDHTGTSSPGYSFETLWRSIHGEEAFAANPEVIALTFTVHKTNIDRMKEAA